MMKQCSITRLVRRAALGFALATAAAWPRLGAQEPTPPPMPSHPCDSCGDEARVRMERDFERARAALERSRQALEDALEASRSASDSSGAQAEALARAQGEMRRAQQRYSELVSRLMVGAMERARQQNELAMRDMQMQLKRMELRQRSSTEGWLGVTFSCDCTVQRENGREVWRFSAYPTVEAVDPDSPAERAGVEARDKIVALDGRDVVEEGVESFSSLLKPGKRLDLRVKRGRLTKDLTVLVTKRPASESGWAYSIAPPVTPAVPPAPATPPAVAPEPPNPLIIVTPSPMPGSAWADSGIGVGVGIGFGSADQMTVAGAQMRRVGSLSDYFGVSDGLLVLHVVRGTVADHSGLRDGDVIVRADGHAVTTPSTLVRALYRATDKSVKLDVVRKKARRTVVLRWER